MAIDTELLRFAKTIEDVDIACMIVGSVASMTYGEPRSTLDIDVVVNAGPEDAGRLAAAFDPARYYLPPLEVMRRELGRPHGTFNIIDERTSLKADLYVQGEDEWNVYGFAHRVALEVPDLGLVFVAPPTCVIAGKLRYYAMSQQDKHLRDIRGMLALDRTQVDMVMLEGLVTRLGLDRVWRECRERAGDE